MKRVIIVISATLLAGGFLMSCATAEGGSKPVPSASASPSASPIAKRPVSKEIQVQVPVLSREEVRYPDGTLIQTTVITLNAKGDPLKEEIFNQKKNLLFTKNYSLSADGMLETITTRNPAGEIQGQVLRESDGQGRLIKETLLNERKEIQTISEYSWDKDGLPVNWISRRPDGSVVIDTRYRVAKGQVNAIELSDDQGKPVLRFEQTWNDQGQLLRKTEFDPVAGAVNIIDYRYAGKLLVREDYSKPDGSMIRSIEYSYDGKSVPSQIRFLDRRGSPTEIRKLDYAVFTRTQTITVLE
jgi:hypothetical protein